MDGLSTAAGAFAVVSLAIRLVETVKKIREFLHSVEEAPTEVIKLTESLNQLYQHLSHARLLIDKQSDLPEPPSSFMLFASALTSSETIVQRLETVTNKFQASLTSRKRLQRKWASIKLANKKEEIEGHHSRIRDANTMLHNAINIHLAFLVTELYQQMRVTTKEFSLPKPQGRYRLLSAPDQNSSTPGTHSIPNRVYLKKTIQQLYSGILGRVSTTTKTKHITTNLATGPRETPAIEEETMLLVTVPILRRAFEIRLACSRGCISRTLNVHAVLPKFSPIFDLCVNGDIQGLQVFFASTTVSPFVEDQYGRTLLHFAAIGGHHALCSWLLSLGVDPNHRSFHGDLAISWRSREWKSYFEDPFENTNEVQQMIETVRVVAGALDDIASSDLAFILDAYSGPPRVLELLFLQNYGGITACIQEFDFFWSRLLARALEEYGDGLLAWDPLIRVLVHRVANVHESGDNGASYYRPTRLTLLDSLFLHTETPLRSEEVGDFWLQILADEGYDVDEYLKTEMALRAPHQHTIRTCSQRCGETALSSRLVYSLDGVRSISWDWIIDPDSRIFLLQTTFKEMAISLYSLRMFSFWAEPRSARVSFWELVWPLQYPLCDRLETHPSWPWDVYNSLGYHPEGVALITKHARERANRRMKKKAAKLARLQRPKRRPIPGAWPS